MAVILCTVYQEWITWKRQTQEWSTSNEIEQPTESWTPWWGTPPHLTVPDYKNNIAKGALAL